MYLCECLQSQNILIMFLFSVKHAYLLTTEITPVINHSPKFFFSMIICILDLPFGVWLWPQLNWCSMLSHSFVSKFLQEISIIVILIFCLNFPSSKYPSFALIYYQFSASVMKKCMTELMKSINTTKSYKVWFSK